MDNRKNMQFTTQLYAKLNIEIFMPDNTGSFLNGIVRKKIELLDIYRKNGFGIELTEKGMSYRNFLQPLMVQTRKYAGTFI